MALITSPELYINQKSIPDSKSIEYDAFFMRELEKITYGVTINGIFIHGWLYWHLNHWNLYKDKEDERNKDVVGVFGRPDFRDNEWIIAEHLEKAEKEKKGLMIFGSRRLGKSVFESGWIGRGATIYEGSENVVSSTNSDDLRIITSLIDKGLNALHPFFKQGRINDDWSKNVVLGFKNKQGERYEFSRIVIRNLEDGKKTEGFAGLKPKTLVIDEVGKANFAEAFESAKPAFTSAFGWRTVPILVGTGGTMQAGSDAEKYFTNPESHNFLACEYPNKRKKYGLFVSGLHRMEGKVKTTFGEYLQTENGILLPSESELNNLEFYKTDRIKAKEVIQSELDTAIKDHDPKAYLKQRMYFPEDPDDCFLTDDGNDFPLEQLRDHLNYLETADLRGEYVVMKRLPDLSVTYEKAPLGLKPVADYPVEKDTIKDAPVVIYEHPIQKIPPYGLYIAGADPYNQSQSTNSESLGSFYVYKRVYDVAGGTFQDTMVASYVARPATMKIWHETVELLMDYYNAICMPENEGGTFIQYFDQKNKGHMLADGMSFLKTISPHTTVQGRIKGLPATQKVKEFYMNLSIEYTKEEIQVGTNTETGEPIMKMGLIRILDPMLIREYLAYRKGDGNYDRIVAFGHALACNIYFNKLYPVIKMAQEDNKEPETKAPRSPFILKTSSGFGGRRRPF